MSSQASPSDDWLSQALADLDASGRRRRLPPVADPPGREAESNSAYWLNLASNDYLGLGNDPALGAAAARSHDGIDEVLGILARDGMSAGQAEPAAE